MIRAIWKKGLSRMNNIVDAAVLRIQNEASYVFGDNLNEALAGAPYLIVRPTDEMGDYTITVDLAEAAKCQFKVGFHDRPPTSLAFFNSPVRALEIVLDFKAANPGCAAWYDGNEIYAEINGWNDLLNAITQQPQFRSEAEAKKIIEDLESGLVELDGLIE